MLLAGHALWAVVGGGILCVTLGELSGLHKNVPIFQGGGSGPTDMVPYMLASAGQPSLHGYYACMVLWVKGAFWRNYNQILCKTSFSVLSKLFLLGGEVHLSGISGLVGPDILVPILLVLWWRSLMLVGGLRMGFGLGYGG